MLKNWDFSTQSIGTLIPGRWLPNSYVLEAQNGLIKRIDDGYGPSPIGIHCVAHRANLALRALSNSPLYQE